MPGIDRFTRRAHRCPDHGDLCILRLTPFAARLEENRTQGDRDRGNRGPKPWTALAAEAAIPELRLQPETAGGLRSRRLPFRNSGFSRRPPAASLPAVAIPELRLQPETAGGGFAPGACRSGTPASAGDRRRLRSRRLRKQRGDRSAGCNGQGSALREIHHGVGFRSGQRCSGKRRTYGRFRRGSNAVRRSLSGTKEGA